MSQRSAGVWQVGKTQTRSRQAHRGTVAGAAHVDHDSADRVGDQTPPGPTGGQGPGSQGRHRRAARPDAHLRDLDWCGGQRGDELGGGLGGGSNRGGFRQIPPVMAGQTSPAARGVCAVERLERGGGALARAGSTWLKTEGVVGALAAPRIAVLEPVVYDAGARAENARVVSGGILWLGQATWVGQAAQRNGDVDVDADACWQRKVAGG